MLYKQIFHIYWPIDLAERGARMIVRFHGVLPENETHFDRVMREFRNNYQVVRTMSHEAITKELALEFVRFSGDLLRYIPDALKKGKIVKAALEQNLYSVQHVPERHYKIARKYCLKLAKKAIVDQLSHIPIYFRTKEICEIAAKAHASAIAFIPDDCLTDELILTCLSSDGGYLSVLFERCPQRVNDCMMRTAISSNVMCFFQIPPNQITKEMIVFAIQCGLRISNLKPEFISKEAICCALKLHPEDVSSIPAEHWNKVLFDEIWPIIEHRIDLNDMLEDQVISLIRFDHTLLEQVKDYEMFVKIADRLGIKTDVKR